MAFRSTSPILYDRAKRENKNVDAYTLVRECPIGVVLRETPYIYDAISTQTHVENGAVSPFDLSSWGQRAVNIVSSERSRLRDISNESKSLKNDAAIGKAVIGGRRG